MKSLLLLTVFFAGCAGLEFETISEDQFFGEYWNGNPFWPRTLELTEDRRFDYNQMTDIVNQDENGNMVFEGSWGISGTWSFFLPDRIILTRDSGPPQIEVVVRIHPNSRLSILEPELYPGIIETWTGETDLRVLTKR
jgi:hypothetical protein